MDLERARKLKIGDSVACPPDRGESGYIGVVTHLQADATAQTNIHDVPYIWITVRKSGGVGTAHVWPSNRLG